NNKGTYTVDGVTYTLKVGQRNNAPSIEGTSTFQQVFAVRSSYQTCGTINVTEHFKNWEKLGVKLGGIYDCKILCEVGGGSGSIEYTCASMSWKGQNSSLGDLSCKETTDVVTINNDSKEFAIVPNPASTEIFIISDGEVENVMIFNTIGDVVAKADESRVDISSLPTGIYFVKATIDGESVVKKLVVTK
ncbi:MAG: glycoside hydrolase family 11 protein, partial [Paludibacteraceae bacterium]|nr:glycoside hydrolase family 11 protein [Paludibacteraceae bacterium]